jgi:hypothetical protein
MLASVRPDPEAPVIPPALSVCARWSTGTGPVRVSGTEEGECHDQGSRQLARHHQRRSTAQGHHPADGPAHLSRRHAKLLIDTAAALDEGLGERAMQIHLQRIVGAFVGSAYGAGQFYSRAVSEARDATAKAACDARNEDVDGPVGFDSAAQRKRQFAADMALQSHALRMAAEGAVTAYEQVVGEAWKPFERSAANPGQSLDRRSAELQMAALG